MPPLTVRTKRLSLSADLPAVVDSALRRLGRLRGGTSQGRAGRLVVADGQPEVRPEVRDPRASLSFFQSVHEQMKTGKGSDGSPLPTGWGEKELQEAVSSVWWYHTIELPHGVTTPGTYDHRPLIDSYDLPATLDGERVLDVATYDGFWAFEFERRGGNVVATDIACVKQLDLPAPIQQVLAEEAVDWEIGSGFRLAHQALASSVDRIEVSIYDLDPAEIGTFDLVHVSDLLLHLHDPIAALVAVAGVTHGRAIITDCYDPAIPPGLTRYSGGWAGATWWLPSLTTLVQMVSDAGFRDVQVRRTFSLPTVNSSRGFWRASLLATK